MKPMSRTAREFLARYDGIEVPDWETAADLSRMGVESMARDQAEKKSASCIDTCIDTPHT